MNNNKFKLGVSDWFIAFEHGESVNFDTVISESVKINANGTVRIVLKNATFDTEFIDLFKKGNNISEIHQKFPLDNNLGEKIEDIEYFYKDLTIKSISIVSAKDAVAEVNVVFATQKN